MMLKDPREQEMITFRVIVDSGPAARDLFIITVPVDDDVSSIRAAVASHIGIPSMCLYKVSHFLPMPERHHQSFRHTGGVAHATPVFSPFLVIMY